MIGYNFDKRFLIFLLLLLAGCSSAIEYEQTYSFGNLYIPTSIAKRNAKKYFKVSNNTLALQASMCQLHIVNNKKLLPNCEKVHESLLKVCFDKQEIYGCSSLYNLSIALNNKSAKKSAANQMIKLLREKELLSVEDELVMRKYANSDVKKYLNFKFW